MSPAGARAEQIQEWLRKNVGRVFISVLFVATAIVGLLTMSEANQPPEEVTPPPSRDPKVYLFPEHTAVPTPAINPEYFKVMEITQSLPAFEQSQIEPLGRFNMFDPKAPSKADEQEKRAEQMVKEAQALFDAGDYAAARIKLNDIAKIRIGYKPAENLLRLIDERSGARPSGAAPAASPAAPPTATPAPAAPAP